MTFRIQRSCLARRQLVVAYVPRRMFWARARRNRLLVVVFHRHWRDIAGRRNISALFQNEDVSEMTYFVSHET